MSGEEDELEGGTLEENMLFLKKRVKELEQNQIFSLPNKSSNNVSLIRSFIIGYYSKSFLFLTIPVIIIWMIIGFGVNYFPNVHDFIINYNNNFDKPDRNWTFLSKEDPILYLWSLFAYPYIIAHMWDFHIKPFIKNNKDLLPERLREDREQPRHRRRDASSTR
tara:strand:- start:4702 stop:5193 length:492 start_codon:yes stop_codon:yes gene_type:complete